jgi:hypothetical protein
MSRLLFLSTGNRAEPAFFNADTLNWLTPPTSDFSQMSSVIDILRAKEKMGGKFLCSRQ